MENKRLLPLNLQFFAEPAEGEDVEEGSQNSDNQNQNSNNQSGNTSQQEKTFTQAEMTATATKEKKEGKNSILKLFNIKDEKSAKAEATAFLAWKASQQTEEEKAQQHTEQLETDKTEAEKRATAAENKLTAFEAGVNKDSIEDALAIASLKVTEDKTLEQVLEDMKTQAKYKGFFGEDTSRGSSTGTGSGVNHGSRGGGSNSTNIGRRLAEKHINSAQTKSNYFKN